MYLWQYRVFRHESQQLGMQGPDLGRAMLGHENQFLEPPRSLDEANSVGYHPFAFQDRRCRPFLDIDDEQKAVFAVEQHGAHPYLRRGRGRVPVTASRAQAQSCAVAPVKAAPSSASSRTQAPQAFGSREAAP